MTHRIDSVETPDDVRLAVRGLIDHTALAGIRAAIAGSRGRKTRIVLKEGCEIDMTVVDELRRLQGVELVAESPFLARWLTED